MKYSILLADPPWTYADKANAGERGACYKYPTMGIDEICALPVSSISADDSVLFIWGTWALLPECLRVIKAWGFEYKTVGFVWVKAIGKPQRTRWFLRMSVWMILWAWETGLEAIRSFA